MRGMDSQAFREDLRKIGVACITAGLVGIFITPHVAHMLICALILLGGVFWLSGLLHKEKKQ